MNKIILVALLVASCGWNNKGVEYVDNYDGDTITVNLPCDIDVLCHNVKVRVRGIDTPEIRKRHQKESAIAVREYVKSKLSNAENIKLYNMERGKYFRVVANVVYDGVDLGKELLSLDMAKPYSGQGTKPY